MQKNGVGKKSAFYYVYREKKELCKKVLITVYIRKRGKEGSGSKKH